MNTLDQDEWDVSRDGDRPWAEEQEILRASRVSILRERQKALSDELAEVNRQLNLLGAHDGR